MLLISTTTLQVTPQQPSSHPEWRDLFDQNSAAVQQQFLNMRHLGRRIGYFINDVRKGMRFLIHPLSPPASYLSATTQTPTTSWRNCMPRRGGKRSHLTRKTRALHLKRLWYPGVVTSTPSSGCTSIAVGCARGPSSSPYSAADASVLCTAVG